MLVKSSVSDVDGKFLNNVICGMKADALTDIVVRDDLIVRFGTQLYRKVKKNTLRKLCQATY